MEKIISLDEIQKPISETKINGIPYDIVKEIGKYKLGVERCFIIPSMYYENEGILKNGLVTLISPDNELINEEFPVDKIIDIDGRKFIFFNNIVGNYGKAKDLGDGNFYKNSYIGIKINYVTEVYDIENERLSICNLGKLANKKVIVKGKDHNFYLISSVGKNSIEIYNLDIDKTVFFSKKGEITDFLPEIGKIHYMEKIEGFFSRKEENSIDLEDFIEKVIAKNK